MLNAGKNMGTIKNAFSDVLKLISGREKTVFLFARYITMINATVARLSEINNGTVDSGVLYPKHGNKLFNNNPNNSKNDMLSPTDNTNFSVSPSLFNFSVCKINNPGNIVSKKNPMICLENEMFKRIITPVSRIKPIKIHSLILRLFINFIFSLVIKMLYDYNLLSNHDVLAQIISSKSATHIIYLKFMFF